MSKKDKIITPEQLKAQKRFEAFNLKEQLEKLKVEPKGTIEVESKGTGGSSIAERYPNYEPSAANDALIHSYENFNRDWPEDWDLSKINNPTTVNGMTITNPIRYCKHCDDELMTVNGKWEHHDGRYADAKSRSSYYDWKNDPEGYADHVPMPEDGHSALNSNQFKGRALE